MSDIVSIMTDSSTDSMKLYRSYGEIISAKNAEILKLKRKIENMEIEYSFRHIIGLTETNDDLIVEYLHRAYHHDIDPCSQMEVFEVCLAYSEGHCFKYFWKQREQKCT